MTTTTKTQLRGTCQCCGRDQAVLASGLMSKHGYSVENGWFNGVCSGQNFKPLQKDRTQADAIVRSVRADCARLDQRVADLRSGKVTPETAETYKRDNKGRPIAVPFAEAEDFHQERAVTSAIYNAEQRARMGRSFANELERLADSVHGTELRTVIIEGGPAPILRGEKRQTQRGPITATSVERGRVYWKDDRGYSSWTGAQSWRKLPLA